MTHKTPAERAESALIAQFSQKLLGHLDIAGLMEQFCSSNSPDLAPLTTEKRIEIMRRLLESLRQIMMMVESDPITEAIRKINRRNC